MTEEYGLDCGSVARVNVTTMRPGTWCDRKMEIQMKIVLCGARLRLFLAFIAILPVNLSSQEPIDSKVLSGMQWRSIGPFRGGRVTTVAGAADPNTTCLATPGEA